MITEPTRWAMGVAWGSWNSSGRPSLKKQKQSQISGHDPSQILSNSDQPLYHRLLFGRKWCCHRFSRIFPWWSKRQQRWSFHSQAARILRPGLESSHRIHHWLVVEQPPWQTSVSIGMILPFGGWKITNMSNHQSVRQSYFQSGLQQSAGWLFPAGYERGLRSKLETLSINLIKFVYSNFVDDLVLKRDFAVP